MGLMGIMGIVLVLMEIVMVFTGGFYWWDVKSYYPKTLYKKEFCNGFTGKS